jgi:hypothetical protein
VGHRFLPIDLLTYPDIAIKLQTYSMPILIWILAKSVKNLPVISKFSWNRSGKLQFASKS